MDEIMTPRQRFIKALHRIPFKGPVPTYEQEFFLTMEAFGEVHRNHRYFYQWDQMSKNEQNLHYDSIAKLYIKVAEKYDHSAIFINGSTQDTLPIVQRIREYSGDKLCLLIHGDPTFAIPDGEHMVDFAFHLADEPEAMKALAQHNVDNLISEIENVYGNNHLIDGFALCSDYCFNQGPFLSPSQFSEFVAPYLYQSIKAYRDMGFVTIKHTDGNIMPIIDQLVQCQPDAIHSIDPQGHCSLREVKKLYGDRVAFCGNVNCGLLQTGSDEEAEQDVRRALNEGMADGKGFIFCTSNCVYTGMPLQRYEMMIDIWRKEGIYR